MSEVQILLPYISQPLPLLQLSTSSYSVLGTELHYFNQLGVWLVSLGVFTARSKIHKLSLNDNHTV